MRTRLMLLASLATVAPTFAQEDGAAKPAPVETPAAAPVPAPEAPAVVPVASENAAAAQSAEQSGVTVAVSPKSKDALSVDFPDEEIRTILRNVADLFELNLVVPDTLQGRTSLKLREVTWRQIYQVILSPIGYTFVEDGNIIKIVSQDSLQAEPVSTEIFIINYAKADDIVKTVSTLVDPAAGGKIIVDSRSNAIVVTERPSRMGRIRPIVERLDKATEQVAIESKFIQVNAGDTDRLGLDWTAVGGLTLGGTRSDRGGLTTGSNPITALTGTPTNTATTTDATNYATAVLSRGQLDATLNFLKSNTNSKIINNPTVVTLNNTEAKINVGEQYPIPSYTYNAERGAFEISGFQYKDIGANLKVVPQINSQGFIRMTVEPEISTRSGVVTFGGGGGASADIPIIQTQTAKTQVSLKDGHTLAIGGLIKDKKETTEKKLPFLGSIPGIGRLFRSDSTTIDRTNLLIFITAKIVSAESAKTEEIFDSRQIRDAKLKRSDISGYRETGDPFLPEDAPVDAKK